MSNTRFWRKQLKEKSTLGTLHIRMEMRVSKVTLRIWSALQRVPPPPIWMKSLEVILFLTLFPCWIQVFYRWGNGVSDLLSFTSTDLGQPQPPGKFTPPLRNNTFVGHKTDSYCWSNASKYVSCYFRNCYKVATNCNCNNSHRKQMELTPSRTQAEASALLAFWLIWIKSLVFGAAWSTTIPQWRGDCRLAMTVIKVAKGRGREGKGVWFQGKWGQTFVMNH